MACELGEIGDEQVDQLRDRGCQIAVAHRDPGAAEAPFLEFSSGYVLRGAAVLPKQGATKPWKLNQNYALEMAALKLGKLDDGVMKFVRSGARVGNQVACGLAEPEGASGFGQLTA